MAGRIKSLLPTLSVSLPAIITGVLIFSENKLDPLTSLFSKSEEEKKQEEETKGKEDGDKDGDAEGKKGEGKKSGKGQKGDKDGEGSDIGEKGVDSSDLELEGAGKSNNSGLGDSAEEKEALAELGGTEAKEQEGTRLSEGQEVHGEENGSGQESREGDTVDNSNLIGPSQREGEAEERTGSVSSGGRRGFAIAFGDFEDVSEDFY